jgi:hypothetical protein
MSTHPEEMGLTQSSKPIQGTLDVGTDYTMIDDEQLIIERARQRRRLDELTVDPGSSPAVVQLLAGIERDVERMTDQLIQRALSRRPASRSVRGRLRTMRSLPTGLSLSSPHTGQPLRRS